MRSFFGKLGAVVAFGACVYPSTGCGSSSSNFYDTPSGAAVPASGGSGAFGTAPSGGNANSAGGGANSAGGMISVGQGGQNMGAGGGSSGGSGGMGNPNNAPCSPAKDASGTTSGPFGTTGEACVRVTSEISGWNCSNFDGRTLKLNGQVVMCGQLPLPDRIDGAYYFDASPGVYDYASLYWY